MARYYGRSQGKGRVHSPRPYHRGNKYSMMSAISINKIVSGLYCEGSVDGEIFTGFIEKCLVPELKPNHKIIMDNVAFHKVSQVEVLIKATGAEIIYLPPYSPDLSPIELDVVKSKNNLKEICSKNSRRIF